MARSRLLTHVRGPDGKSHRKPMWVKVRKPDNQYLLLYPTESSPSGVEQAYAPGGVIDVWVDYEGRAIVEYWSSATTKLCEIPVMLYPQAQNALTTDMAQTIQAVHTLNPSVAGPPFTLGANAAGQLVSGLNVQYLQGKTPGDFNVASWVLGRRKTTDEVKSTEGRVALEESIRDTYNAWDGTTHEWTAPSAMTLMVYVKMQLAPSGTGWAVGFTLNGVRDVLERVPGSSTSSAGGHSHNTPVSGTTDSQVHRHLLSASTSTDGAHSHDTYKDGVLQSCDVTCSTTTDGAHAHSFNMDPGPGSNVSHDHTISVNQATSTDGAHSHPQAAGNGWQTFTVWYVTPVARGDRLGLWVQPIGEAVTVQAGTEFHLISIG